MGQRLGEILLERGVISTEGLRSGLEACRRNGGRLGTWLVRLGLVGEGALLDALARQTGCAPVTTLELATVPVALRALLPPAFAARNLAVPFARHGRSLEVAMADPNNLVLVDEIASITGLVPRPRVATEAALLAAMALAQPSSPPTAARALIPTRAAPEWRLFWRLESATPDLLRALEAPPSPVPGRAVATFPELGPVAAAAAHPANADELGQALAGAGDRGQVADLVVDRLAAVAFRVALFAVHQGKVTGWRSRGGEVVAEDFHNLIVPLDRPSVFLNLASGVDVHAGPLSGAVDTLSFEALGDPPPTEAVIVPVRVRGRTVAFLWLDQGGGSATTIPLPLVREVAHLAGLALEILVLRQKLRATRLTGGASPD